jgi:hypothetical protein
MSFFQKKPESPEADVPSEATPATPVESAPEQAPVAQSAAAPSSEDIFQSLGENFFSELSTVPVKKEKKTPMETFATVLSRTVTVGFAVIVLAVVDSTIRDLDDPGFLRSLPVCGYLALGINDDNADCGSPLNIATQKEDERDRTEKTIVDDLLILIPKKLESGDLLGSPEIRFIKEHTGDSRVPLSKMVSAFMDLTSKTDYQGEDVECSNFSLTEKGEMEVNCEFYGDSISSTNPESKTSRITAIKFLDTLVASDFRLINPPKTLPITPYKGSDTAGIRAIFSTSTQVKLKLQYLPNAHRS